MPPRVFITKKIEDRVKNLLRTGLSRQAIQLRVGISQPAISRIAKSLKKESEKK